MKPYFLFLVFICSALCNYAQKTEDEPGLIFTHLTTKNGLSFNDTRCIIKDSHGYMWIGTQDGLNKYNGRDFKVYRHNFRNPNSLIDSRVSSLAEDKDGGIWIGTESGLSRLNPVNDSFVNYTHIEGVPSSLSNNFKVMVYCDEENNLWCGTHQGLDRFDRKSNSFLHYNLAVTEKGEIAKSINTVLCIKRDSEKRLWIGTLDGLFLFDEKNKTFKKYGAAHSSPTWSLDNSIECIFEDHLHQLWVGTWGGGLKKFFPEENRFESYCYHLQPENPSTTNVILAVAETKNIRGDYELWLATIEGPARFNEKNNSFICYWHDDLDPTSAAGNTVNAYCDNTNLLWLSCAKGVDLLDEQNQFFTTHRFNRKFQGAFGQQMGQLKTLVVKNTHVWAGAWYGNAAYRLSRTLIINKVLQRLPPDNKDKESAQVSEVYEDAPGSIWFCTFGGLVHYNEGTNSWKLYTAGNKSGGGLPDNHVTHFLRDSKGIIWVSFYRKGLYWFNEKTNTFSCAYTYNIDLDVTDLLEDDMHNIWLATENEALLEFDRLKNTFISYPSPKYTPDVSLTALMLDKKNRIWCATRKGISIIDIKTQAVKFLTSAEGLSNDVVNSMLQDNLGRVWIATAHGLNLYDENRNSFRIFYQEDGLPEDALNGAFVKAEDGSFLLGGNNYICEFTPAQLPINGHIPPVIITTASVFGEKIPFSATAEGKKTLHLNWQQKQIAFDFDVLNFRNPAKNKFYCRLDGFDKDWREVKNGIANYTNLDAGSYVFHVRGANNDGVLNEKGDEVLLFISPPFWRTMWFYLLSVALLGTALYVLYRYRLNQLLKIERMRTRIAMDLHDDIGATLSSISMLTHIAELSDATTAKEFLQGIGENSRALIDRMDDIVWSLKPNNDSLEKIFYRLCQYAAPLMNAKNIVFETNFGNDALQKKIDMNRRQNIYLIAKEAINNLLKYSGCSKAALELMVEHGEIVLRVTDNGRGISEGKLREGNGLLNMKKRADEIGALLSINSNSGTGTRVELRVKIV